jgi:5-methylcytosine-specific restriction protein B
MKNLIDLVFLLILKSHFKLLYNKCKLFHKLQNQKKQKFQTKTTMNNQMKYTWIPFYKELSAKLLDYKNKRAELVEFIYSDEGLGYYTNYLHTKDKDQKVDDIDPFSFFGIFNTSNKRNKKIVNRIEILNRIKNKFDIKSDVPSDFEGIPLLNYLRSFYFNWDDVKGSCDMLWKVFEDLLTKKSLKDFFVEYNFSKRKAEVTMPLFWINPDDYIALDSKNKDYLSDTYNIDTKQVNNYKSYLDLLKTLKQKMKSGDIKEKTFAMLSANADHTSDADDDNRSWYDDIVDIWKKRKNIVLYGAPGSGKTYDVPELVVRLCDQDFYNNGKSREEIMERYNQLKTEKRIAFTTFHQSMDYEDWIEGLRPIVDDNQVSYRIENGIFKCLCEVAEQPIIKDKQTGIADDAVVWKVSLMGTGENTVRTDCMENNYIRIGWDGYGADISEDTDWSVYNGEGKQILDAFINKMKIGDIVMSCYSSRTIDAVGVVVGDYEFVDSLSDYKRVRKVNWLLKGLNENIVEMNGGKTLTLSTVYRLNSITLDNVKSLLEKHKKTTAMETNTKPYVMVIDEMNRGNVSKIFGELITLLEADKRKGKQNAESVILPYSKESFQIPENVYLIATMNTADRSLGSLDYAIRRRFAFMACKPLFLETEEFNTEIFKKVSKLFVANIDEYEESGNDQALKIIPADTLSEEYRPEDVWIGHSYFIMKDEDGNDISTDRIYYEIIPLLEEYVRDGVLTVEAQNIIDELYNIAAEK